MEPQSLYHYGVKGMKWGVRRSQAQLDKAANRRAAREEKRRPKEYTKDQRQQDSQRKVDRLGQKRIEKDMSKGKTHEQAARREKGRQTIEQLQMAIALAALTTTVGRGLQTGVSGANQNKAKNGAASAAATLAENGLTNYSTIVAKPGDYSWT